MGKRREEKGCVCEWRVERQQSQMNEGKKEKEREKDEGNRKKDKKQREEKPEKRSSLFIRSADDWIVPNRITHLFMICAV